MRKEDLQILIGAAVIVILLLVVADLAVDLTLWLWN
jgi:hypothetical protein